MKFNEERTYGVEIEFKSRMSRADVARQVQAHGVDCYAASYNHSTWTSWKVMSDASISGSGWELVSPPMKGLDGLRQVRSVCKALDAIGATVDRSCGLHVHHDASDLSRKNIKDLLNFYIRWEPIIDLLMPASRRGNSNTYCQSVAKWADRQGTIAEVNGYRSSIEDFNGSRYTKLNLESLNRHGTVEFRQHSGTTENSKIGSWIVLTQTFVERAKLGRLSIKCVGVNYEKFKKALGLVGRNMEDGIVRKAAGYMDDRFKKFARPEGIKVKDFVA